MKIKNIFIISAMVLGLSFGVSSGFSYAEESSLKTFEEFAQDTDNFAKWEKEHQAHIKKIQELKDEKRVKRLEYKAFTHNPNAEPKLISKIARELVMLDRQIKTLNENFMTTTREKYGVDFAGFRFHRDLTPCFKNHYDQYAHPCPQNFDRRMPHYMRNPHRMPPHHGMRGNCPYGNFEGFEQNMMQEEAMPMEENQNMEKQADQQDVDM